MAKVLIVVDMQHDFIDGSLGTPEARAILSNVAAKIRGHRGDICVTLDTHGPDYLNTQEGRNLPVEHCVKGTQGHRLHNTLRDLPGIENAKIFEKPTFGSLHLAQYLKDRNDVEEVELIGVCTDICVVTNALLIKAHLTEIPVKVDSACCAGVTPEKHQAALETMRSCQIQVL